MQLREALRSALANLQEQNIPSPELAAELLLMHVLGRDRAFLYTYPEFDLPSDAAARYFELIAERATGKPTQYITGHQEFWGLDFEVTPDVLIPRPETENLVEAVLTILRAGSSAEGARRTRRSATEFRDSASPRIVDVGTGSGCIALALASELPDAMIVATDLSSEALAVAQRNEHRLGLRDRVYFVEADLLSCFMAKGDGSTFDFVVSNPPYVSHDEIDSIQREVRDFEPRLALGGAGNSTEIYEHLFSEALAFLRPGGYVAVEIGYNQSDAVVSLLGKGWEESDVRPDLAGIPRVVVARKPTQE